jgi:SAM-dependent methyltransferase
VRVREPIDHVFLANVFHGVPDQPRLTRAVRDVLKPGGVFAIVSWYARPREETTVLGQPRGPATELRMTPRQTIEVVEASGLTFREQTDVSPYHYAAIFDRA